MQGAHGISRHSERNIRGRCTFVYHRQICVPRFKCGDFSTFSAPRLRRHKTVATPEITDQIYDLVFEDRKISFKSIGEQVSISLERVGIIIKFRNFSSRFKWIPCANVDHVWNLVVSLWRRDQTTFNRVVACRLSSTQNIASEKIRWKISRLDFWDQDGILLIDYLPKDPTINAEYY